MAIVSEKPRWLLRSWGRDVEQLTALREPDAREDGHVACWWFQTKTERDWFKDAIPSGLCAVRDTVNPGLDSDGEVIDTRACTKARVVLRLPDGRTGTITEKFGYGYPRHSVEFMFREGNYSCDCNKRLMLERAGIDMGGVDDDREAENPCGDTIELVSLDIFHEPLD